MAHFNSIFLRAMSIQDDLFLLVDYGFKYIVENANTNGNPIFKGDVKCTFLFRFFLFLRTFLLTICFMTDRSSLKLKSSELCVPQGFRFGNLKKLGVLPTTIFGAGAWIFLGFTFFHVDYHIKTSEKIEHSLSNDKIGC